jgi:rare lipoprotein A
MQQMADDRRSAVFRNHRIGAFLAAMAFCLTFVATAAADPSVRKHRRVQTGFATYYSRVFDGDTTASGKPFDADAMVAAHRTLPFGTTVRVVNLENGRRVRVRIVDRGPYGENWREGTIVDVSPEAARRLGMLRDGQVRARVEVIRLGPTQRS